MNDIVIFHEMGAHTLASATQFNGIAPPRVVTRAPPGQAREHRLTFLKLTAFVDGGGTKTRVRLVDHLAGVSAEEIVVGPANLGLGSEACWNSNRARDRSCWLGPASAVRSGTSWYRIQDRTTTILSISSCPTVLVSDRDAGSFGAHSGRLGLSNHWNGRFFCVVERKWCCDSTWWFWFLVTKAGVRIGQRLLAD